MPDEHHEVQVVQDGEEVARPVALTKVQVWNAGKVGCIRGAPERSKTAVESIDGSGFLPGNEHVQKLEDLPPSRLVLPSPGHRLPGHRRASEILIRANLSSVHPDSGNTLRKSDT